MNMGKKKTAVSINPLHLRYREIIVFNVPFCIQNNTAVVPLQVDSAGKVRYDVLAKIGHTKDRVSPHLFEINEE